MNHLQIDIPLSQESANGIERIVERIVEVDRIVEVERIVEVLGPERIVEVEKIVYVP